MLFFLLVLVCAFVLLWVSRGVFSHDPSYLEDMRALVMLKEKNNKEETRHCAICCDRVFLIRCAWLSSVREMDFDLGSCFSSTPLDHYTKYKAEPSQAKRAREPEITKEVSQQHTKREKAEVTIPKADVQEPPRTCPLPSRRPLPPLMQPLSKRKNEIDDESGTPPPPAVRSRGPPPLLQTLPSSSTSMSTSSMSTSTSTSGPPPLPLMSNDDHVDHTRHIKVNSEPPVSTLDYKLDPIDTLDENKAKVSEAGVEGWRASDRLCSD